MISEDAGNLAPDLTTLALAVLTLLVDERQARIASQPGSLPTEVLLESAGLSSAQIGALLRKSPGTIRKDLSRARKTKQKPTTR